MSDAESLAAVPLSYCSCCDTPLLPNGNCPSPCELCTRAEDDS